MKRTFVISFPLCFFIGFLNLPGCSDPNEVIGDATNAPRPREPATNIEPVVHVRSAPGISVTVEGETGALVTTSQPGESGREEVERENPASPDADANADADVQADESHPTPLVVGEQEKSDNKLDVLVPLTHICFKEGHKSYAYYLYKEPAHKGRLCELYYQNYEIPHYADWQGEFCEETLIERLRILISENYTCVCGSPAGSTGMVVLTDTGYVCENMGAQ